MSTFEVLAKMDYGDHRAAIVDERHLKEIVCNFVKHGIESNRINVLLVLDDEESDFMELLVSGGVDVHALVKSEAIIIIKHDELYRNVKTDSFEPIREKLLYSRKLAKRNGKSGLNIASTFANSLCKQGKYDDCLTIEKYWHDLIPKFSIPLAVLHFYEHPIPAKVEKRLIDYHNNGIVEIPALEF